jgi:transporter family-2 protein
MRLKNTSETLMSERKISLITNIAYILIAFSVGVALSVQAAVNGQLAVAMGGNTLAAAFYSFLTGTIVLTVIAVLNGNLMIALSVLPKQSWEYLIGGLLGAAAISGTILLAPRIGLANLLALVIAGQLLSSLAIDHFGILGGAVRPVSVIKAIGALVMISGVLLTLFGDRILDVVTVGLKHN